MGQPLNARERMQLRSKLLGTVLLLLFSMHSKLNSLCVILFDLNINPRKELSLLFPMQMRKLRSKEIKSFIPS